MTFVFFPQSITHVILFMALSWSRLGRKEGNVLFNDTLSTFYLRLYGVRHMVKDHSDSHIGYSLRLTARVLLYAPSHRQDSTYHGFRYTSRGALAGREIPMWVHHMKDRSDDPSHHERTPLPLWSRLESNLRLDIQIAEAKSLVGTGFVSWYQLTPREDF